MSPSSTSSKVASAERPLVARWLGQISYGAAEGVQDRARQGVLDGEGVETLLLLEHPPVVTLGRNASRGGIVTPSGLAERGVEVAESDRGGEATFHGPGQLVGYPVIDLKPDRRDVRRYVRDLEAVLIATLADLDVEAEHSDESRPIGVWVGMKKIASIGVHLRRWVTTHGFALNLTTDLSYFSLIQPCGLDSSTMTSVEALTGKRHAALSVARLCAAHFSRVFCRGPVVLDVDCVRSERAAAEVLADSKGGVT